MKEYNHEQIYKIPYGRRDGTGRTIHSSDGSRKAQLALNEDMNSKWEDTITMTHKF